MNEKLIQAAKDSLGVGSMWIDDEQYGLIVDAVIRKSAEIKAVAGGFTIDVSDKSITVISPDGETVHWGHRPSGTVLYDLCLALSGARDDVPLDWMQTFTAKKFYPLAPDPALIDIVDIAHALSMDCRFGGQCIDFYAVAEHSCHVHDAVLAQGGSDIEALIALLHDATESYLRDMIRPVKKSMPIYRRYEHQLWLCIAQAFGLPAEIPKIVHDIDNRILADEKLQNMAPLEWDYEPGPALGVKLQFWTPKQAEREFLARFHERKEKIACTA